MGQVKNKIAISGAAGSFGRMVLEELKRKGIKNVIAATREPEKLKDFEKREPGEEVVENEYLGKRQAVFTM